MKHATKKLFLLLSLALLSAFAACDAGNDPASVDPSMLPQFSSAPNGWHGQDKEQLRALEKLEKERIKAERELRKAQKDSLKKEFEQYKKSNKLPKSRVGSEFVLCEPRDYDADTKIIGPDGGELHVGDHKLIIPEGALEDWTLITMEALPSLLVEVQFTPHGVHFDKQPQLKLSYERCYVPHDHPFRMVYIDDANNILEWPTSVDLKHWGVVWGWINHFSKYALASN